MIVVLAELSATLASHDVVAGLLSDYGRLVRAEPGNLEFRSAYSTDDPSSFWVYEEYRDDDAFQAHIDSPHNDDFNRAVGPHLRDGAARLRILSPLPDPEVSLG